ncbi:MAG: hypothetical protein NC206_11280 [Bacteroides sp.]|nr:hypothetical protein [Bacteroides sp.]
MKRIYEAADIPAARKLKAHEGMDAAIAFAADVGCPLIAKPNVGVGAGGNMSGLTHVLHLLLTN